MADFHRKLLDTVIPKWKHVAKPTKKIGARKIAPKSVLCMYQAVV